MKSTKNNNLLSTGTLGQAAPSTALPNYSWTCVDTLESGAGNSLVVQWLGLRTFNATVLGAIPDWGSKLSTAKNTKGRKEKSHQPVSLEVGWLGCWWQSKKEDIFFSLYFPGLIDYIEHASFYHFMQIQNDLSKQTIWEKKMFQDVNSH